MGLTQSISFIEAIDMSGETHIIKGELSFKLFYDFEYAIIFRTAWTFVSGMFVYGAIWLLLGESTEDKLSSKQWKEFMVMSIDF
jgi:hypothetical protein